jgi:hypothetical protein
MGLKIQAVNPVLARADQVINQIESRLALENLYSKVTNLPSEHPMKIHWSELIAATLLDMDAVLRHNDGYSNQESATLPENSQNRPPSLPVPQEVQEPEIPGLRDQNDPEWIRRCRAGELQPGDYGYNTSLDKALIRRMVGLCK